MWPRIVTCDVPVAGHRRERNIVWGQPAGAGAARWDGEKILSRTSIARLRCRAWRGVSGKASRWWFHAVLRQRMELCYGRGRKQCTRGCGNPRSLDHGKRGADGAHRGAGLRACRAVVSGSVAAVVAAIMTGVSPVGSGRRIHRHRAVFSRAAQASRRGRDGAEEQADNRDQGKKNAHQGRQIASKPYRVTPVREHACGAACTLAEGHVRNLSRMAFCAHEMPGSGAAIARQREPVSQERRIHPRSSTACGQDPTP